MKSIHSIFENHINESADIQASLQKYVKKLSKTVEKIINSKDIGIYVQTKNIYQDIDVVKVKCDIPIYGIAIDERYNKIGIYVQLNIKLLTKYSKVDSEWLILPLLINDKAYCAYFHSHEDKIRVAQNPNNLYSFSAQRTMFAEYYKGLNIEYATKQDIFANKKLIENELEFASLNFRKSSDDIVSILRKENAFDELKKLFTKI